MSTKTKALIAVVLGNSIFGFSFLFSKTALQMTIPSVMLAIRFTTAFVVLNLIVLAGRIIKRKDGQPLIAFSLKGKPLKEVLLLSVFQPVIYFFAESYGITYTSSAFAGTIIAVVPVIGIILDVIIMHTKVTGKQVLCAVGSVVGVAVTTLGAENMKSSALGLFLLLFAVISGSSFYVLSKKAGEHFSALERTYVMFGVGCVAYILLGLLQARDNYAELVFAPVTTPAFWGCILYLAAASSVIAFLLLNFGSSHVTVSQGSLFANFATVISIAAGIIIVHEPFNIQQIVGAAIILASVYAATAGGTVQEEK